MCLSLNAILIFAAALQSVTALRHVHYMSRISSPGTISESIKTKWFQQKLDHFNIVDRRVWNQRYMVNDEYYNGSGPVFLMIGGEGEVYENFLADSLPWIINAKHYGALCFVLEHRYYGKSQPIKVNVIEDLKYLSSRQAIEDLAVFMEGMNEEHKFPSDVKWIVFGGSYAGNLAAWVKSKYPFLVHGAVSVSAPVLAKLDFTQYFEVVAEAIKYYDPVCISDIKEAFHEVEIMLETPEGRKLFEELFPTYPLPKNQYECAGLFDDLTIPFAYGVQYDDSNDDSIRKFCRIMTNETLGKPVDRLSLLSRKPIETLNDTENKIPRWEYQCCSEFGYFQTSEKPGEVFGDKLNLNFYIQNCMTMYTPEFNQTFLKSAIESTNGYYGGLSLNMTNIVFVHGSADPWHTLGILKSPNPQSPVILIKGASHCAVMNPEKAMDTPQLKNARKEIVRLVGTWLKN